MTTLDDRIAAHPVAAAMQRMMSAWAAWDRSEGGVSESEEAERAEAALIAALDAADRDRAELARLRAVAARVEALPQAMAAVVKRLESEADAVVQDTGDGLYEADRILTQARGVGWAAGMVAEALGGTTPDAPVEAGALCPWGTPHPAHDGDCPGEAPAVEGEPPEDWCPTCGVPPEEPCQTKSGRHLRFDHAARTKARRARDDAAVDPVHRTERR